MTYILIFLTAAVSIACFNNRTLFERLALTPYVMIRKRQWERIVTHGFVHADYTHLIVNMFVLWSFGTYVQRIFAMRHQAGIGMNGDMSFLLQ